MFLVFKQYHDERNPKKVLKQKDFVLEMVSVLMKKAEDAREQNLHLPPLFIDPLAWTFPVLCLIHNQQQHQYPNSQLICDT